MRVVLVLAAEIIGPRIRPSLATTAFGEVGLSRGLTKGGPHSMRCLAVVVTHALELCMKEADAKGWAFKLPDAGQPAIGRRASPPHLQPRR